MTDHVDVAIVGAGIAGVYAAWRLATSEAHRGKNVQVYEYDDRVGGRLLSASPPGMPNTSVELGGMRFFSSQVNVDRLVRVVLGLPVEQLDSDRPENLAMFRGRRHRRADLDVPTTGFSLPGSRPDHGFDLSWPERQVAPTDLLSHAVALMMPTYATTTDPAQRKALVAATTVDGKPLREWGFWNLLARLLSHEAYELLKAVVGYDSTFVNWNAAESIGENLDFDASVQKFRVVGGYDRVPQEVARRFVQAGGTINFGHRLRTFEAGEKAGSPTRLRFDVDGKPFDIETDRLILAMPRTSIEGIHGIGSVLDRSRNQVHELIETVQPDPLVKISLTYDQPWWESLGVTAGRSLSDQPIRQCYYWDVEERTAGGQAGNRNAALLLYNDAESIDFFTGYLEAGKPFQTRPNRWTANAPGSRTWHDHAAPEQLVAEAHRQVVEMHDVRGAPEPYAAAVANWSGWPYGGGANFWLPHIDPDDVIPRMATPVPDLPIHVIGEAWSNGQSWVEGALQTAELVLQRDLGLDRPDWLADQVGSA